MDILIVDMDSACLKLLEVTLKRFNHHVTRASSANKAKNILLDGSFDLLITEYDLGEEDGLQIILTAKKNDPQMLTILLTDSQDPQVAINTFRHGADAFLLKPLSINELILTIDGLLENSKFS